MEEVGAALLVHRSAIVRHCYRMLGSFAEAEDLAQDALERAWAARDAYTGAAPVLHWLYAIATNACLNTLARRKHRELPQLEREPMAHDAELGDVEPERWITPAPEERLFPDAAASAEAKETVSLAFVALAQRLPPRQRAVLLLRDVLDFSAAETAEALELTVPAVNSALHRARETMGGAGGAHELPSPAALDALVKAWATRDLDALVALLRNDVVLAMPPYPLWLRGREAVERFFGAPRFAAVWSRFGRVVSTRANGQPALAFSRTVEGGGLAPHAVMVVGYTGGQIAEMTVFIGPPYLSGFDF